MAKPTSDSTRNVRYKSILLETLHVTQMPITPATETIMRV